MMKKMRMIAAAVIAALTVTFGSAVTAFAYPAYVQTDMNFRNGPGTNYTRIGGVPAGALVDVVSVTQNGWERVTYNGVTGYISGGNTAASYTPSQSFTPAQPAPASQTTGSLTVRNLKSGYLAIRTAPAYDYSNEIGQLYNGMRVTITGGYSGNGYVYVYSPDLGISGWVNQSYVG